MRINKSRIISSVITILTAALFVILIFLPQIINNIPSEGIKHIILTLLFILLLIFKIFETYNDIRRKQFTTTAFIVLVDIIQLIALVVLWCFTLKSYDYKNINELAQGNVDGSLATAFYLCTLMLEKFLKSKLFRRKT